MRALVVGDGVDVLEREFFVAQGGEELAFGIAGLDLNELVELGVVTVHQVVDRRRQAARAGIAIDFI